MSLRSEQLKSVLDLLLQIRRPFIIVVHAVLVVFANLAAFWLRFDGDIPEVYVVIVLQMLPWLVAVRMLLLSSFRLFEGLWKYTSLWDLRNIVVAVTVSTVLFIGIVLVVQDGPRYPRSIYIVDSLLLVGFLCAIRLSRRLYREMVRPTHGRRVLIYGAGDAGEMIVRDMRQNAAFDAQPIGFIDDDDRKVGQRIHGVPVLGTRSTLPQVLAKEHPDEVLIAIPSAPRESLRQLVRLLEPYKVRITTLPRLSDLIGDRIAVSQIRQLKVEDLLARDAVGLDLAPVRRFMAGKRVLVTGAGGSIGSELCRQIVAARPATLLLLDRYENSLFHIYHELADAPDPPVLTSVIADITDALRIDQVFDHLRPDVIFHAAAHKHVPLMEDNPCEAVKNNVRGTRILAEAAARYGVERFVMVSTDKAVNPTSVMGASKRVSELVIGHMAGASATRFAIVRFGNVLGSNGSVVPRFVAQIAKGGPVTVTHREMRRFFMLIPEAVQLVLCAAAIEERATLCVLDMGEQVKVDEMARNLIRLSGFVPEKDIAIEYTGLRPGEKLFEELVGQGEVAEPSSIPKVWSIRTVGDLHPGHAHLAEAVSRLEAFAASGQSEDLLEELCRIVPNFTPTTRPSVTAT